MVLGWWFVVGGSWLRFVLGFGIWDLGFGI
jgi:hypothetical protein